MQYYKENISIIRMVEAMGYAYNHRKGRHPKQYEHPNGDKVIINDKLYPKVEVYFTRNNYEDKGTVVDFVKNRLTANANVFIYGYTDRMGEEKVNKRISEQRAKAVASRLKIPKSTYAGIGESQLLYNNDTPEGRFYCRTVTITIETPINQIHDTFED